MAPSDTQANPVKDDNPTPEERAEFVMQQLEQFIRDGRTISEGMNFRQWQDMAKAEIANAIIEAQVDMIDDEQVTKRLLFTFGASFTTIGFWGGLWAYDQMHYLGVAFLCGAAGLIMIAIALEWRTRKYWKRRQSGVREKSLRRVQDLTRRIRKMEHELEKEEKRLKKDLKAQGIDVPDMPDTARQSASLAKRIAAQATASRAPSPTPSAPAVPPSAAQTAGKSLLDALKAKQAG